MKTFLGLFAVTSLCLLSPVARSRAQALSPEHGIDDVEVVTITAVVDSINLEKHQVKLTLDDGKTKTYKVDKSAQNLDQVQVGDHVKIACTEELMVAVNKAGETPSAASRKRGRRQPQRIKARCRDGGNGGDQGDTFLRSRH